jgi:molybdate transport system substrate-binding protein
MLKIFSIIAISVVATTLSALSGKADTNIFAAASLKGTMEELAKDYQSHGGTGTMTFVYGGSSALAKQIESGAPAGIFISADTDWMDDVEKKNLIKDGTRFDLVGNTLVLVGKAGEAPFAAPSEIVTRLGQGKLATGDVKSVPAGKYAKAALTSLGVFHKIEAQLVQTENVRAALQLVATGEATLGIVYGSDAKAEPKVAAIFTFPDDSHPKIIYPAAEILANASADAESFLGYLQSQAAQDIMAAKGFVVLKK